MRSRETKTNGNACHATMKAAPRLPRGFRHTARSTVRRSQACLRRGAHLVTLTGVFSRCRRPQLSTCMALTLEQYATYLDSRDLTWPAPPDVEAPKARPHL